MKILKKILIVFISILALLFVISVFLPSVNKIERSITFKGNADSVFNKINNLKRWNTWNTWQRKDPSMQITYYGPEAGIGATQHWTGKDGNGKLSIVESRRASLVIYQLQFEDFKAMEGYFEVDENKDSLVTINWVLQFDAGNNPIMKYFGLFMDKMMAKDFEEGLSRLADNTLH